MTLQELLQVLVNKHGSDLHVRSGGPAYVRVDGDLSQVSADVIPAAEVEQMLMQVASARAKKTYEQFFAFWKDADPDIPLLLQAGKEYAALK